MGELGEAADGLGYVASEQAVLVDLEERKMVEFAYGVRNGTCDLRVVGYDKGFELGELAYRRRDWTIGFGELNEKEANSSVCGVTYDSKPSTAVGRCIPC